MRLENSKPTRIDKDVHEELKKIKEKTGVPIVKLIEFAIPLLKEKYGIDKK